MYISTVSGGPDGNEIEEFAYDTDFVPVEGDRIIHEFTEYLVTTRTWNVNSLKGSQWVRLRVEAV